MRGLVGREKGEGEFGTCGWRLGLSWIYILYISFRMTILRKIWSIYACPFEFSSVCTINCVDF